MSAEARFRLALERIEAGQWLLFERLASVFLADELPDLRTMASAEGDRGRDSELFSSDGSPQVVAQYSIRTDWAQKIKETVRRLQTTRPDAAVLLYLTNQSIGAAADDLRTEIRDRYRMHLDIRDASWFVERLDRSPATRTAYEDFAHAIVDPYLASRGIQERAAAVLTTHESRAALLYLVLQRRDDDLGRQLTRLCFDALVRAVLWDTDNEHTLDRATISSAVHALLPTHGIDEVTIYVDRALERLNKRYIRHWQNTDSFCLTFDERTRIAEGLAELTLLDRSFTEEIQGCLLLVSSALGADLSLGDPEDLQLRVRRVLEQFLFERGEAFVQSLRDGQSLLFASDELAQLAIADRARHVDTSSIRDKTAQIVAEVVERLLVNPNDGVREYLRAVGDAYTLFAFLRETPNVQSAVGKLFSHGEIWLDTTVLLPLMAETLFDDEAHRNYTRLILAARDAGAHLYVTPGVVEEVVSHLSNSRIAWRAPTQWRGRTPFLLAAYVWSGSDVGAYPRWLENFAGQERPIDDLAEYLTDEYRILLKPLTEFVERAADNTRWQAEQYWREVHEKRRGVGVLDPDIVKQLANHDVENFVGVLERRSGEEIGNPFGYSAWWLTLDRFAHEAAKEIAERADLQRLDSPAMSLDFLTYYLSVGPARHALETRHERRLPLVMDTSLLDALPEPLLEAAQRVRDEFEGQPDRVIRRKIRDHLDQEKLRSGRLGRTSIETIRTDLQLALSAESAARAR